MGDQRVMPERQLPKGSYLRRAASAAGAPPCTDAPPEPMALPGMEQPATRERGDFRGSAGDEPASPERARHGRVSWESQSAPPLSLAFRAAFQRRREKERKHWARRDSGSGAPGGLWSERGERAPPLPPARRLL